MLIAVSCLSPVSTQTLMSALVRLEIVSGTPCTNALYQRDFSKTINNRHAQQKSAESFLVKEENYSRIHHTCICSSNNFRMTQTSVKLSMICWLVLKLHYAHKISNCASNKRNIRKCPSVIRDSINKNNNQKPDSTEKSANFHQG